jgi:hypothetical protein
MAEYLFLTIGQVAAISADFRFVAGPATSALSTLSFVAYRYGILAQRHFHLIPEGSLFDKSFFAHCLFHPIHLLSVDLRIMTYDKWVITNYRS